MYLQVKINKSYDVLNTPVPSFLIIIFSLVKENWNAQIIHITSTIIQSNLPTKITKFIAKNVFGVNEK